MFEVAQARVRGLGAMKTDAPRRDTWGTNSMSRGDLCYAFGMFWKRLFTRGFMTAAEKATQEHSAWLTEALRSGRSLPRIPVKRADEGGFDALRARPSGEKHAERWWRLALEKVDD